MANWIGVKSYLIFIWKCGVGGLAAKANFLFELAARCSICFFSF
jgi:hypothetical protein